MGETNNDVIYEWETPEYEDRHKRGDWYLAVTIIGACLGVVAMIYGNFLFGIFILIATGTLIMLNLKRPRIINCQINERGLQIGEVLYPYGNIKNFAIIGSPSEKKIVFETERFFMPHHYISIPSEDSGNIEEYLRNYIAYDDVIKEPVAHQIMDRLEI